MSTSRSTDHPTEIQRDKTLGLIIDADDCFLPPELPTSANISFSNWVFNHIEPLLEKEIAYIKTEGVSRVILCLWSNRQDIEKDLYNAQVYYKSQATLAYPYQVFGRCAPLLPILQSYLANKLREINCEVLIDTVLKGDLDSGAPPGTTFKQMLSSISHPEKRITAPTHYNFDKNKISLLQAIASRIATAYPQSDIFLKFYDDLPEVIEQNYLVFKNFNLLPANIREIFLIACYRGKIFETSSRSITFSQPIRSSLLAVHFEWLNFYLQSLSVYDQHIQENAQNLKMRNYLAKKSNLDLAVISDQSARQCIALGRARPTLIKNANELEEFVSESHKKQSLDRSLNYHLLLRNSVHLQYFINTVLPKITHQCPGVGTHFTTAEKLFSEELIPKDWLYRAPVQVSVAEINMFASRQSEQRSQQSSAPLPQCCI